MNQQSYEANTTIIRTLQITSYADLSNSNSHLIKKSPDDPQK